MFLDGKTSFRCFSQLFCNWTISVFIQPFVEIGCFQNPLEGNIFRPAIHTFYKFVEPNALIRIASIRLCHTTNTKGTCKFAKAIFCPEPIPGVLAIPEILFEEVSRFPRIHTKCTVIESTLDFSQGERLSLTNTAQEVKDTGCRYHCVRAVQFGGHSQLLPSLHPNLRTFLPPSIPWWLPEGSNNHRTTPGGNSGCNRNSGKSSIKCVQPHAWMRCILASLVNSKYTLSFGIPTVPGAKKPLVSSHRDAAWCRSCRSPMNGYRVLWLMIRTGILDSLQNSKVPLCSGVGLGGIHPVSIDQALHFSPIVLFALLAEIIPHCILGGWHAFRDKPLLNCNPVENPFIRDNGVIKITTEDHACQFWRKRASTLSAIACGVSPIWLRTKACEPVWCRKTSGEPIRQRRD